MKSPIALCLLLLLCAGVVRAEPLPFWAIVDESNAIVHGKLTDVVSWSVMPRAFSWLTGAAPWLGPLFTVHGRGALIVEESFVGPFQPGDRVWLEWARPIEAESVICPPPFHIEKLAGRKGLWLLHVGTGESPAVYDFWDMDSATWLEQLERELDIDDPSERVRLVRNVVLQHLDRVRFRE